MERYNREEFEEVIVNIGRVTKVVKGGRRFRFTALVVVGNRNGLVGFGFGKAKEVPDAIKKAVYDEFKKLVHVKIKGSTIDHDVKVKDNSELAVAKQIRLAEPDNKSHIGSSIPGGVSKLNVKPGDKVEENQVIAIIEAMKMETSIVSRIAGTVDEVLISVGQTVKAGELLAIIKA